MIAIKTNESKWSKSVALVIAGVVMAGSLLVRVPETNAAHPEIKKIADRDRTAITLGIRAKKFADERVRIKVTVVNVKTGEKMTDSFTKKLDNEGDAKVKIRELKPGTRYKFYYRVKEIGDKNYHSKSDSEKATTKI